MENKIDIKKQIQIGGFIVHTEEIIPFPLERMFKSYPKLETKGYIKIPFDVKLSEENYAECVLEHFKKAILSETKKPIPREEMLKVANAMIKYGGSFVESLGKALLQADENNQQKIKNTFPEYWEKYKGKDGV